MATANDTKNKFSRFMLLTYRYSLVTNAFHDKKWRESVDKHQYQQEREQLLYEVSCIDESTIMKLTPSLDSSPHHPENLARFVIKHADEVNAIDDKSIRESLGKLGECIYALRSYQQKNFFFSREKYIPHTYRTSLEEGFHKLNIDPSAEISEAQQQLNNPNDDARLSFR